MQCRLLGLVHEVDKSQTEILLKCANYLKKLGQVGEESVCLPVCLSVYLHYDNYTPLQYAYAAEVYDKMEDHKALVTLYVETHQWDSVRVHYQVHSSVYHDSGICSLISRPSPLPDFDHFQLLVTYTIQLLTWIMQ